MKKYMFLFVLLCWVAQGARAQDDDVYFVPSKKQAEQHQSRQLPPARIVPIGTDGEAESDNWATGRGNGNRDVDSYNRRGRQPHEGQDSMTYVYEDDYETGDCTVRLVRFHSPRIGVYVSSPFYADYYDFWYDPWFGPAWYGWGSWYWGWRPYYHWSAWHGWGYPWHDPWGPSWGWHPGWNRPPHHLPAHSLAGTVYRGSNGGVIRYGTGRSATRRSFATGGNTNRPVYRGTSSSNRGSGTTGTRTSRSSRSTQNNSKATNSSSRTSRSFERSATSSGSRSSYSSPSRSGGGYSSGGGRSFGGGGRSGGGRR